MTPKTLAIVSILVLAAALCAGFLYVYIFRVKDSAQLEASSAQSGVQQDFLKGFPQDAPTPDADDLVQNQKEFRYIVSFSGGAFRPASLSVQAGETVRFVNNGGDSIQIAIGSALSPVLIAGEYWHYTIPVTTTKQFTYKTGSASGTLKVK